MSRFHAPIVEPILARISLAGPPGGGKSWTAMKIATALVLPVEGKVAGICTERGSLKKIHHPRGPFRFDVLELDSPSCADYIEAINEAAAARYDALVIDSFSHAWDALLNKVGKKGKQGWGDVRADEAALWNAVLRYPGHVLATLRVKSQHQEVEENGKKRVQKVAGEVKQREGTEYEFDICLRVEDSGAQCDVEKSRCEAIRGKRFAHAGADLVAAIRPWLDAGQAANDAAVLEQARATIAELRALAHPSWHDQIDRDIADAGRNVRLVTAVALKLERSLNDAARLPRGWKPGQGPTSAAGAGPGSSPTHAGTSAPSSSPTSSGNGASAEGAPAPGPGSASTSSPSSASAGTPTGGPDACPTSSPQAPSGSTASAPQATETPSGASSSSQPAPASTSASSTPNAPTSAPAAPSGIKRPARRS